MLTYLIVSGQMDDDVTFVMGCIVIGLFLFGGITTAGEWVCSKIRSYRESKRP